MLLAAEADENIKILFNSGNPGDNAVFGKLKNNTKQIKYDDFAKLAMVVKDKKIVYNNHILSINGKPVEVDIRDKAKIC